MLFHLLHCGLWGMAQYFPDLQFKHHSTINGMPTDNVLFTYQDKQQLLWIATAKGLVRFDGLHYKLYNNRTNIKAGFKGKAIGKILEDSLSNLWVGTETGLHYYRRKDDQFDQVFYKKDRAGLELIMPQYIDQQNQLWVYSSVAEKLVCYDLERKTFNEQPIECSERLVFFSYPALQVSINDRLF